MGVKKLPSPANGRVLLRSVCVQKGVVLRWKTIERV